MRLPIIPIKVRKIMSNVYERIIDEDDIPSKFTVPQLNSLILPDYEFSISDKRSSFSAVKMFIEQQREQFVEPIDIAKNIQVYINNDKVDLINLQVIKKKKKLNF